ncbi:MAG: RNA polymerase sigma factor RpoH [Magnetococcales bacterium]|nr:RNA polymerase sigma factor RpoH [Magnetococcales bacterium]
MYNNALITISDQGELSRYMDKISSAPILTEEEEFDLAVRFHEHEDLDAAHELVSSYLRYVVKIAKEYQYYGMRIMDLIQEGSVGLMQAVKKFDPYKGFRLSTYAMWWIRSAIQEFILRSWSLVKIGTTTAQRKLFFKLRQSKQHIDLLDESEAAQIGTRLGVTTREVLDMDGRMYGRDDSLNRPAIEEGNEVQDMVPDHRANQEMMLLESEQDKLRHESVAKALGCLSEREKSIVTWRLLIDPPLTLEIIGERLGISRERVRQLEKKSLSQMKKTLGNGLALTFS